MRFCLSVGFLTNRAATPGQPGKADEGLYMAQPGHPVGQLFIADFVLYRVECGYKLKLTHKRDRYMLAAKVAKRLL